MKLSSPVDKVPKIGSKYKEKLKKLDITTVGDLLFHLPNKYQDFSSIKKITDLQAEQPTTIKGQIKALGKGETSKKNVPYTEAVVEDETAPIKVVWLYQPYLINNLSKGEEIFIAGEPTYSNEGLQFINPSYEKKSKETIHTSRLVPIYPETEGVSSRWLRYILKSLIKDVEKIVPETLPETVIEENNLLPIHKALKEIHFPSSQDQLQKARQRFSFERLLFIQLAALKKRRVVKAEEAVSIEIDIDYIKDLTDRLPFQLTDSQRKSAWQIIQDLEKPSPMNRLLEGDVGSGKTVVATIAALAVTKDYHQAAFMAPTEILAKQHFEKISDLLKDFNLNIGFLTGKKDKFKSKKLKHEFIEISREKLLEKVEEGEIDLLIGTHALIQDKVTFQDLALVIVDEQHRFGVDQRAELCKQEEIPHLLSMTATPIPRTLALTLYGDLDISIIDELPEGRKQVITKQVKEEEREETYELISKEIEKGRQAFVICPRIEEPEKEDSVWANVKSVVKEKKRLAEEIFPDYNVENLHGQLSATQKSKIMKRFQQKEIDILVSTSVVEVGIDIPNATIMLIEGAEMFGLAQLHQFRGRVGRGSHQSYCFLFSNSDSEKAEKRLQALVESDDSFELAEKDLKLRGPGDLAGKRQWGVASFTMKALQNKELVTKTKETAKQLLSESSDLSDYPLIKKKLKSVEKNLHFE